MQILYECCVLALNRAVLIFFLSPKSIEIRFAAMIHPQIYRQIDALQKPMQSCNYFSHCASLLALAFSQNRARNDPTVLRSEKRAGTFCCLSQTVWKKCSFNKSIDQQFIIRSAFRVWKIQSLAKIYWIMSYIRARSHLKTFENILKVIIFKTSKCHFTKWWIFSYISIQVLITNRCLIYW